MKSKLVVRREVLYDPIKGYDNGLPDPVELDKTFGTRLKYFVEYVGNKYGAGDFLIDEEWIYLSHMADKIINVKIKEAYDTEANQKTKNPVLLKGQMAISSDKRKAKVGDGTSTQQNLSYMNAESANSASTATKATQDASGNVITSTYATKTEVSSATLKWGTF